MHSQLLIWEFCQSINKRLWWQNEQGFLTDSKESAHQGVPHSSYRNERGTIVHTRLLLRGNNLMPLLIVLRQPAGNVGQQAKDNLRV